MSVRRTLSSIFATSLFKSSLVAGLALVASAVGQATTAKAQDVNLQSRVQVYVPPFIAQSPSPPTSVIESTTRQVVDRCPSRPPESEEFPNYLACKIQSLPALSTLSPSLQSKLGNRGFAAKIQSLGTPEVQTEAFSKLSTDQKIPFLKALSAAKGVDAVAQVIGRLDAQQRAQLERQYGKFSASIPQPFPVSFGSGPQKGKFKIVLPTLNPTYETNVLKSDQNVRSDTSLGLGGQAQFTQGINPERIWDVAGLATGLTSVRYAQNPSKSFDATNGSGFYQVFLNATDQSGRSLEPGKGLPTDDVDQAGVPKSNEFTVDTLLIGAQNLTTYLPTFHSETADLFTPQAVFTHQNMDLSGSAVCTSLTESGGQLKSLPGNCLYADFAVGIGQTLSDQPTQTNANAAVAGTLGYRFDNTSLVLAIQTVATGKTYETYTAGGRRDLLLQAGPTLTYAPTDHLVASLSANYYQQYSTVSSAVWHGWVIQPTLSVLF